MRRAFARALATVLLLCASGCAFDVLGRTADLEDAQKRYTRLVRWGEFGKASEFVAPEALESFLADTRKLDDVRFTEWERTRFDVADDRASATVCVTYKAYRVPTMAELHVDETQHWVRAAGGNWRVTPDLGALRDALARATP